MYRIEKFIFLLAFGLVARRELFIRQRDGSMYASIDVYAFAEILIVGLMVFLFVMNSRVASVAKRINYCSVKYFFYYLVGSALLAPFSANPTYSAFFAIEYGSQVAVIFYIVANARSLDDLTKRLLYCCLIVTILSVSFKLLRHGAGGSMDQYKSNGGAACACMTAVFSFSLLWSHIKRNRNLCIASFLVAVLSLLLTTSAASIISTFFGLAVACFVLGKGKAPLIGLLTALTIYFALNPEFAFSVMFPGKEVHEVTNLHGRTTFWTNAMEMIQESPLIGFGYAMAAKLGDMGGTNLHNSMLSILLGSGVLGVLIFLTGLFCLVRESFLMISLKQPVACACIAAFSAGLLNSNSLSFFGEDWRGAGFIFVLMWCAIGILSIRLSNGQSART